MSKQKEQKIYASALLTVLTTLEIYGNKRWKKTWDLTFCPKGAKNL